MKIYEDSCKKLAMEGLTTINLSRGKKSLEEILEIPHDINYESHPLLKAINSLQNRAAYYSKEDFV